MPLATPRTWVVGETVTDALMNQEIRGQVNELIDDRLFARKTADTARATAVLSDDPHLTVLLKANAVYTMEAYLILGADADGTDFNLDWTVPTGASGNWTPFAQPTGATAVEGDIRTPANNVDASRNVGALSATDLVARPAGIVVTSTTSGTYALSWARNAASGTATLRANSWLLLQRIE